MFELTIGEICDFCGGELLNIGRNTVIKKVEGPKLVKIAPTLNMIKK